MARSVNYVVALHAEARPLIDHFHLERQLNHNSFRVFENEIYRLIVSGIGKTAAENAVEYLIETHDGSSIPAWLNVGICGHPSQPLGGGFLANKIEEESSGDTWYPSLAFPHSCQTGKVITVDDVEIEYANDSVYEMEASGFFRTACRYSPLELVQCYKIVSDNREQSPFNLTGSSVSDFIKRKLSKIEEIAEQLSKLAELIDNRASRVNLVEPFLERWNFSVTQQHMLRRMLMKCAALGIDISIDCKILHNCSDSRSVIRAIEYELDTVWAASRH